ncbi:hypothetical protein M5K25_022617 [Dendrobium thyrsiflorum]|uniref:Uncharacterized protein n=1 Tax=Dendrobium thyrsiflorum TaxID=117978 RepID=A0ABD0UD86_DENTH
MVCGGGGGSSDFCSAGGGYFCGGCGSRTGIRWVLFWLIWYWWMWCVFCWLWLLLAYAGLGCWWVYNLKFVLWHIGYLSVSVTIWIWVLCLQVLVLVLGNVRLVTFMLSCVFWGLDFGFPFFYWLFFYGLQYLLLVRAEFS